MPLMNRVGAEDAARAAGADGAGDNGLGLEVLAVEHLHRGDGRSQGRTEDGPQTGCAADQHEDALLAHREFEQAPQPGAEAGADLGDGSLATGRVAGGEDNDGGQGFVT